MSRPACRFCGRADGGNLRRVTLEPGSVVGARARRMARVPVWEHAGCLDAAEAAHAAAEARRREIHAEARAAVRAGDLERAAELIDAAADVLDSHFLPPTP